MQELSNGLRFPEGPVVMPDGAVALVEIEAGRITQIAADGTKTTLARLK
ncbi:MAG: SMP-30/gluconolactonase/LRE family protein, partial [Alphaproteobacteria bacterium]|nr:SMP-30/gluconolactonase/LRE family protein [Alphaproteobacteria bacterium]